MPYSSLIYSNSSELRNSGLHGGCQSLMLRESPSVVAHSFTIPVFLFNNAFGHLVLVAKGT
jgi:hypothetical protein